MLLTINQIAAVCHEVNRAYCASIGDFSQPTWEEAPVWQAEASVEQVKFHLDNPYAPASSSHDSWLKQKMEDGWKYGPVKDPDKKESPCIVQFEMLPVEQQAKDFIFSAIVHELSKIKFEQ